MKAGTEPVVVQGTEPSNNEYQPASAPVQHHFSPYKAGGSVSTTPVSAHLVPPPPPPPTGDDEWQLPPGWTIAHRKSDGRIYYWEESTGRTQWSHPLAAPGDPPHDRLPQSPSEIPYYHTRSLQAPMMETPYSAQKRPDSHQCCSVLSCLTFPPLGLLALYHSTNVNKSWGEGRYGDCVEHSRQANNFSCWGATIGIGIILYLWVKKTGFSFDFDLWD
uniref:WW domain-containing protein n=1 Tax=Ditylum brightwellii TaxID=49249 RepID=A0A7S4W7G0_9STRA